MLKMKLRKISKNRIVITSIAILLLGISAFSLYQLFAAFVDEEDYNSSQVLGNTVYINDLDRDKYYYLGLNYTNVTGEDLPTGDDQELYSEDNLVPVTVTYDAQDAQETNLTGTVSPVTGENQSRFVYYKYYPIVNGKIEIELMDAPFSLRPNGKGFAGWTTDTPNVSFKFDKDIYTRYAYVSVANTNPISVEFHAMWKTANYSYGTTPDTSTFKNYTMEFERGRHYITNDEKPQYPGYGLDFIPGEEYYERYSINRDQVMTTGYRLLPNGSQASYVAGTWTCNQPTCTIFYLTDDPEYVPSTQYFMFEWDSGTRYNVINVGEPNLRAYYGYEPYDNGTDLAGYFYKKDIANGDDNNLYVDSSGNNCASADASCYSGNTYKYLGSNDPEVTNCHNYPAENYRYLMTRDMNIFILAGNGNRASNNASVLDINFPYTVTSVDTRPGSNNRSINSYSRIGYDSDKFVATSDMVVENIFFINDSGTGNENEQVGTGVNETIIANNNNFKIGRNVTNVTSYIGTNWWGQDQTYYTSYNRIANLFYGSTSSTSGNVGRQNAYENFKVILESGKFNMVMAGGMSNGRYFTHIKMVYGSDYDRANSNDNSKFYAYTRAMSKYYGKFITEDAMHPAVDSVIKSGTFGTNASNTYSSDNSHGFYVGCIGSSNDLSRVEDDAFKRLKVEGGNINVINGGPIIASTSTNKNIIGIYFTGGTVRSIFGGAAVSETYGNRIIQVTGGNVLYDVFGGSNGTGSTNGGTDGTVYGHTFLYIGGKADIGGGTGTLYGAEPGCVFGAGAGKEGERFREVGTIASTHIMLMDEARIRGSLYGGGNFGTTGRATASEFTTTQIDLRGGQVDGNVYGSSNNNGSGRKSELAQANYAQVYYYGGTGSVGNGQQIPTTYTDSWWDQQNGVGVTDVYQVYHYDDTPVQQGDVCNSSSPSWIASQHQCMYAYQQTAPGELADKYPHCVGYYCYYYTQNYDGTGYSSLGWSVVNAAQSSYGDEAHSITINQEGSTVTGNIYGGANTSGTVFASVYVNLKSGSVGSKVFAGGKGEDTYVSANMDVEIDGFVGSNVSVYGGSEYGAIGYTEEDEDANAVRHTVEINMNSGTIGTIFGGSMGSQSVEPLVASVVTVNINGGTVTNVYGGNDMNGKYNSSPTVNLLGGTVTNAFGGSNQCGMDISTVVNLDGGTASEVFGGSNISGVTKLNYVNVISGTATNVYGGNNQGGEAVDTNVVLTGGTISNAYGCGKGENTSCDFTKVWINGINSATAKVFGGGARAYVDKYTSVLLDTGTVGTIYGGSNETGNVAESRVYLSGGTATDVYGGNNIGGQTLVTRVELGGSTVTNLYGGGDAVFTPTTNVYTYSGTATNVFGGGHAAGATDTNVEVYGGTLTNVFGGSNENGIVADANVFLKDKGGTAQKSSKVEMYLVIDRHEQATLDVRSLFTELDGINVTWTSSNTNVATISGQTATLAAKGRTTISTTRANKTYTVNLTVTDSTPDNSGSGSGGGGSGGGGGGQGEEWTNTYQYKNMVVHVTLSNVQFNQQCVNGNNVVDDACLGMTYEGTLAIKVDNPYNTRINNYNLIIYSNAPFKIPKAYHYYGMTDFNEYKSNVWLSTNQASSFNTWERPYRIPANTNGRDFGNVRVMFSDRHAVFHGGFLEGTNPADYEQTSSIGSGATINPGEDPIYIYDRTMYDVPTYQPATRTVTNVYGGNNAGGRAQDTQVTVLDGATASTIYGGGSNAVSDYTNVYLENGTIGTVYGGGEGSGATVNERALTMITGGTVTASAYGGGNAAAVAKTSTITLLDGTIQGNLFAAGNQAVTGSEGSGTAKTTVNVVAGTVTGNVYGGANTSVVYGETFVNIGNNVVDAATIRGYTKGTTLSIGTDGDKTKGTIFGGGEANASGSAIYDFNFISVTVGTNVKVDATGYNQSDFTIRGSFFGSGNASETDGYSKIDIKNYGSETYPARNISIQRAKTVKLYNSYIDLEGATDRTNDWSSVIFTISRVQDLYLLDNTQIFLRSGANLLENLYSGTFSGSNFVKETTVINDDGEITSQNVDNKIFMVSKKVLNVYKDQNATSDPGNVSGMAFLGIFKPNANGTVSTGFYKDDYETGDTATSTDITVVSGGTYVNAKHYKNPEHDITVDGFYSHYVDEDDVIEVKYVDVTPPNADNYFWMIGVNVFEFEIQMTASKFSTMGTAELPLSQFENPNTLFIVNGFSYEGLNEGISMVDKSTIPKVAANETDANSIYGLEMSTSTKGWASNNRTSFVSSNPAIIGDTEYTAENTSLTPTLLFYLYHSKNISSAGDVGSVNISMDAIVPINPLESEIKKISITVNIDRTVIDQIAYDAAITPGKQYDLFPSTTTNITDKSSLSAFYSLFAEPDNNQTLYKPGYYRALTTYSVLPVGTTITMIDRVQNEYYYYTVTSTNIVAKENEVQTNRQASYYLRDFIKMDSTSPANTFDDAAMNAVYYHDDLNYVEEEFIFIIDFFDTNITDNIIDSKLELDIRTSDDQTVYTIRGNQHSSMKFSVYAGTAASIESEATLSKDELYVGESINIHLDTEYKAGEVEGSEVQVADTAYSDYKLGAKIYFLNQAGEQLDISSLLGVTFSIRDQNNVVHNYFPQKDGTTRINLAGRVSNVSSDITMSTANSNITKGNYTLVIETFGSHDGLYYGERKPIPITIPITILNNKYGIDVETEDLYVTRDKETGLDQEGGNELVYDITTTSALDDPNLRIALERRTYGNGNEYSLHYDRVDLQDYVTDELTVGNATRKEYQVTDDLPEEIQLKIHMADNLTTGTYRLLFIVCDGDTPVGSVYEYIIIR